MDQSASNPSVQPASKAVNTPQGSVTPVVSADQPPSSAPQPPPLQQLEKLAPADEDSLTIDDALPPEEEQEEAKNPLQNDIPVPPNAVSGPLKELGPMVTAPVSEIVVPTEAEPDIPQEVKEVGVEVSPNTDQPNIPQQVQAVTGIKPANDAVPVPISPSDMIKLPMPEEEAEQKAKTSKVVDSIRWLATLIVVQARRSRHS